MGISSAVILDFDGVVIDSIDECLLISYCAYHRLSPEGRISLERIPENARRCFKEFRYLVGPAQEYWYLWKSIESMRADKEIKREFYQLRQKPPSDSRIFEEDFFRLRKTFRETQKKEWLNLNPLYAGIDKDIKMLKKKRRIFISSTKDSESIELLCSTYNLPIATEEIYGKEDGLEKIEHVKKIAEFLSVEFEDIIFIDDNIEHLKKIHSLGIRPYLAGWGYNSAQMRDEAVKMGIQVIDKKGLSGV